MKLRRLIVPVLALAGLSVSAARADYPNSPIKLVIPLAAGGATDILARMASAAAEETFKQPVIIENRPGAGGSLAATAVIKAPADGYTLLLANYATHTVAPLLLKNVTYDPIKDFALVTLIATQPHLLLVRRDMGVANLSELLAYGRDNPGKISYASSGVGSPLHLAAEYFKSRTGLDAVHVAYKASGPALLDIIAGRVEMMFDNLTTGLPYAQSGELRAIAISSGKRSDLAPDIPTFAEAGLADFETYGWWGIAAPAATPADIIAKLNAAYVRGLRSPETATRLQEQGFTVVASSAETFQSFVRDDIAKWSPVIKAVNSTAGK